MRVEVEIERHYSGRADMEARRNGYREIEIEQDSYLGNVS